MASQFCRMKSLLLPYFICISASLALAYLDKGEVWRILAQTENENFDGEELQVMRNGSLAFLANGYPFRGLFLDEFAIILTPEPIGVVDISDDESMSIVKTLYSPTRKWREKNGILTLGREQSAVICPNFGNRLFWSTNRDICSDAIPVNLTILTIYDDECRFMKLPRSPLFKRSHVSRPRIYVVSEDEDDYRPDDEHYDWENDEEDEWEKWENDDDDDEDDDEEFEEFEKDAVSSSSSVIISSSSTQITTAPSTSTALRSTTVTPITTVEPSVTSVTKALQTKSSAKSFRRAKGNKKAKSKSFM